MRAALFWGDPEGELKEEPQGIPEVHAGGTRNQRPSGGVSSPNQRPKEGGELAVLKLDAPPSPCWMKPLGLIAKSTPTDTESAT